MEEIREVSSEEDSDFGIYFNDTHYLTRTNILSFFHQEDNFKRLSTLFDNSEILSSVINKVNTTLGSVKELNVKEGRVEQMIGHVLATNPATMPIAPDLIALGDYQQHSIKNVIVTLQSDRKIAHQTF